MKTIAILFSLFLCQIAFAQTETGNITVSVENLSSEEGKFDGSEKNLKLQF